MIKQKLQQDQVSAMKAHDQVRLDTVRYIISQINNKEINTRKELTNEETVLVIQKVKKELNESIDSFTKGNRPDLVKEYKAQFDIVSTYLPPELSDDEIRKEIQMLKDGNTQSIAKNPKSLIGIVMRTLKGKAETGRIQKILTEFMT